MLFTIFILLPCWCYSLSLNTIDLFKDKNNKIMYAINGKELTLDEFTFSIRDIYEGNKNQKIIIYPENNISIRELFGLLKIMKDVGFTNITVVFANKKIKGSIEKVESIEIKIDLNLLTEIQEDIPNPSFPLPPDEKAK